MVIICAGRVTVQLVPHAVVMGTALAKETWDAEMRIDLPLANRQSRILRFHFRSRPRIWLRKLLVKRIFCQTDEIKRPV